VVVVLLLLQSRYIIPADMETSSRFGPHSGVCFEERVIAAHRHGKLEPRAGCSDAGPVCTSCGGAGHWSSHCTALK
jgi:hypothetical protein